MCTLTMPRAPDAVYILFKWVKRHSLLQLCPVIDQKHVRSCLHGNQPQICLCPAEAAYYCPKMSNTTRKVQKSAVKYSTCCQNMANEIIYLNLHYKSITDEDNQPYAGCQNVKYSIMS